MSNEYKFAVRHRLRQQILLRAREDLQLDDETAEETAVITSMITEIEKKLSERKCAVKEWRPRTNRANRGKAAPVSHDQLCSDQDSNGCTTN